MGFDKEQLQQLRGLLDDQRSLIMTDVQALLQPIVRDIADVKIQLAALEKMLSEDVNAAYQDIEQLKRKVAKLEREIATLKHR